MEIYHQEYNVSFHKKVEFIQENTALATGAIRGHLERTFTMN